MITEHYFVSYVTWF